MQVAFQCLIRPGSYKIGPKTTAAQARPFDANFSDDELEWSTKERGAVILTGLLVKITPRRAALRGEFPICWSTQSG